MLGKSELGGISASQRQGNDSTNGRLERSEKEWLRITWNLPPTPGRLSLQHSPIEQDARTDKWICIYVPRHGLGRLMVSVETDLHCTYRHFELCQYTTWNNINMFPYFHKKWAICEPSTP